MNQLPKLLQTDVYYKTSDKSIEALRSSVQQFIKQSETLTGKFSSDNEFYIYPIGISSLHNTFANDEWGKYLTISRYSAPVCLFGTLSESIDGTKVSLSIKPNLLLRILSYFCPTVLIACLYIGSTIDNTDDMIAFLIQASAILFAFSIYVVWSNYRSVSSLKNTVMINLDLKP